MNQTQIFALNGIFICLGILAVIFIIYLISTSKDRRINRFKRRTAGWKVDDRIIIYRHDMRDGWLKPEDKFYKLVGWNMNNFIISDLDKLYTIGWLDDYKNVTAENRILHDTCKTDMNSEPGFKINDTETKPLPRTSGLRS